MGKVESVDVLPGCATCQNLGLNSPGEGATACPDCNGSPFGLAEEVQVDQTPAVQAPAEDVTPPEAPAEEVKE